MCISSCISLLPVAGSSDVLEAHHVAVAYALARQLQRLYNQRYRLSEPFMSVQQQSKSKQAFSLLAGIILRHNHDWLRQQQQDFSSLRHKDHYDRQASYADLLSHWHAYDKHWREMESLMHLYERLRIGDFRLLFQHIRRQHGLDMGFFAYETAFTAGLAQFHQDPAIDKHELIAVDSLYRKRLQTALAQAWLREHGWQEPLHRIRKGIEAISQTPLDADKHHAVMVELRAGLAAYQTAGHDDSVNGAVCC